jgi:predicted O-linked N-acetylglucosamine transferase (SPINDLY family)
MSKPSRNDPCPCGSGKKYKHCCLIRVKNSPSGQSSESTLLANILQNALEHHQSGRLSQAEALYRKILQIEPNHPDALHLLGMIAYQVGNSEVAAELIGKAISVYPTAPMYNNIGLVYQAQDKLDLAVTHFRNALSLKPDYAEAFCNMGNALKELRNYGEAFDCYTQALLLKPVYAEAHNNLATVLHSQGNLAKAVEHFLKALSINPDFAEAHSNLGIALRDQGNLGDAVKHFYKALAIKPDFFEAYNHMGSALHFQGNLDEATQFYRKAISINPNFAEAHNDLGTALQAQGKLDAAIECYRKAISIKPDYADAYNNLLFCLSHMEGISAQTLFTEHIHFGDHFEAPLVASWKQHSHSQDPERCLQIGFVSGDFLNHPIAQFIEPVLAHLTGSSKLSLHAYVNHVIDDSTSKRLRGYFANWHPISALDDSTLAQKIRDDRIDILIDLSGHTAKNRLLTFARKPAPLQASWMGYPGTTGLRAMDYYFTDRFSLPAGLCDDQFTEKIVRLPANAPFLPCKDAPPVNTLPALTNGYVTFGSFNRLSKLSQSVVALWSQLLRALPDSKMVLGGMPEDGKYQLLIEWFALEGIARERLSFLGRCGMNIYLNLHQQVDICLDTFPYNGGTTTCHALRMGIPTLTLAGDTLPGRVGAAVLSHVGLEDFVALDKSDFVQKGLFWTGKLDELANLRFQLRERFRLSALGRPEVIAAGVERALRIMWQRWCAGLATESFEVPQK